MMVSSSTMNLSHAISRFDEGPTIGSLATTRAWAALAFVLDFCAEVAEGNGFGDGIDLCFGCGYGACSFVKLLGFLGALLFEWRLEVGGLLPWRGCAGAGAGVVVQAFFDFLV